MEAVMMKNLTTAKQEQPNPDQSIIAFQLIHTLYCAKLLNTATYDNVKKQFGPAITEGQLSSDFLNRFRLELKKQTGRPKKVLFDLPRYFSKVENGELSATDVCKIFKISRSTYYRRYREWLMEH